MMSAMGDRADRIIDVFDQVLDTARWFIVCALLGAACGAGLALLVDLPLLPLAVAGAVLLTPLGLVGARVDEREG
jgi:hypothetical protein